MEVDSAPGPSAAPSTSTLASPAPAPAVDGQLSLADEALAADGQNIAQLFKSRAQWAKDVGELRGLVEAKEEKIAAQGEEITSLKARATAQDEKIAGLCNLVAGIASLLPADLNLAEQIARLQL
ncbi:hypothetical protein OQA88_8920 [Cercophora sp. LCS_1]